MTGSAFSASGLALIAVLLPGVCTPDTSATVPLRATALPSLPEPMTNNAVAVIRHGDSYRLFSFLGLRAGKTWRDTSSQAFSLTLGESCWQRLADVPGGDGRLAGTAVALRGRVYIFGGYTVAEDHSEVSVPAVHAYDPRTEGYSARAPMPVPVDDTVALPYRERFVYLISGWHNSGNVNLVQVYDADTDAWFQATPYPGSPVFGHAGGIVGGSIVVCDGVKVVVRWNTARAFEETPECYLGRIDDEDPARIDWYALPPHGWGPFYRMAAAGSDRAGGQVIFAGGSPNPYNYDGIGYDNNPSGPSSKVFAYSLADASWRLLGELDVATMDHRGLLEIAGDFVIVGGMREGRRVSDSVFRFSLP